MPAPRAILMGDPPREPGKTSVREDVRSEWFWYVNKVLTIAIRTLGLPIDGYDVHWHSEDDGPLSHYFVHPEPGDPKDLDQLISWAHEAGLVETRFAWSNFPSSPLRVAIRDWQAMEDKALAVGKSIVSNA